MNLEISINSDINEDEVITLYQANQWSSAQKPKELLAALRHSHTLIVARISGELVGLANAISDGYLVVYYPHLLIHPKYQRKGIGSQIMQTMLTRYKGFHQQMLTSDKEGIAFYQSQGFQKAGATQSMWIYSGSEH